MIYDYSWSIEDTLVNLWFVIFHRIDHGLLICTVIAWKVIFVGLVYGYGKQNRNVFILKVGSSKERTRGTWKAINMRGLLELDAELKQGYWQLNDVELDWIG